jgi:thiol:disulfide interchange protein/DsbC/DsbD-like thiol-disulfide interchange protein
MNATKDVTGGRICEPLNCNSNTTHPEWQGSATRPSKSFRIFSGFWHLIYVRCIGILVATGFCLTAFTAHAAHTQAKLILSADTARPGDTIWAGVDLKMEPGWHTYWKNPGAAGMATEIKWQLPPGVTADEIQWPLPEKLPPAEVTTYGYENEVMLIVPLTLATNLAAGPIDLKANVSWLECKDVCIPASTTVDATLNIGIETKTSADAATIESWKGKVPQETNAFSLLAWWESASGDTRPLNIGNLSGEADKNLNYDSVDFFPYASDQFEVQSHTEVISAPSAQLHIRKLVKKYSGDWPGEISGVLVVQLYNSPIGYEIKLPIADKAPAGEIVSATNNSPTVPPQPRWRILLYAFIGGLILNIMPCVLPVIALKILGFVSEARSEPRHVRNLGLIYAFGVLVSFLALAAIVIGVKAAGRHAGWGMQFGSPVFIVCLTTLVMLVALNLFGVFEVTLGGRTFDAAGNLASKPGASGAFFNGVLATTLATPCTAPFLAPALGFAFAQKSPVILLVFLFVGVGLAVPYVLLSWNPAWLKFLPKPGAWMEKFKIAMGFPMLATAVWLFNLAYDDYGKNVLWLGLFLVVVAFAAWIFGEFAQRGRKHKTVAVIITLILLGGGYVYALENQLRWREPVAETDTAVSLKESPDGIDWQRWSPEAVAQARDAGKPVLVDFTADWCLTCQVNKKFAIEIPSVRAKLKDLNAVALVGDYTHFPDSITAELNRYNRAGVPLVLVYPKNAAAPPIVLPEVLTPGIVLNALNQAMQ